MTRRLSPLLLILLGACSLDDGRKDPDAPATDRPTAGVVASPSAGPDGPRATPTARPTATSAAGNSRPGNGTSMPGTQTVSELAAPYVALTDGLRPATGFGRGCFYPPETPSNWGALRPYCSENGETSPVRYGRPDMPEFQALGTDARKDILLCGGGGIIVSTCPREKSYGTCLGKWNFDASRPVTYVVYTLGDADAARAKETYDGLAASGYFTCQRP